MTLNAGFLLWGPLLQDDVLKEAELFAAENEQEFSDLSTNHDSLIDLYWTWVDVTLEAKEVLLPGKCRTSFYWQGTRWRCCCPCTKPVG